MLDPALAQRITKRIAVEGLDAPTFLTPILDRIKLAPVLIATERAAEYCDLLDKLDLTIVIDFKANARFSAFPPVKKLYLGIDGLERSWAYALVFTGAYALFVEDTPHAIQGPSGDALTATITEALRWAVESDVEKRGEVYPEGLPKPVADPYVGTAFAKLHFNSFIGAVAWITLHEIGHVALNHSVGNVPFEQQRRDELEADRWASGCLLNRAPARGDVDVRMNAINLGLALAAYLEMWVDHEGERDHPIYPERLVAFLDRYAGRCSGEKVQYGLWVAAALLIFQRAGLAEKQAVFEELDFFKNPREFILKALDAYPDV